MVKEDLYITVPSFFRCPISLDVMKSPVSLCTGVTYDRSSIQRWLDNGNNTCPATMQVLKNKEFVPNRTLQRLIQIWSGSLQHHRPDSSPDPSPTSLLSRDQVLHLIRRLHRQSDSDSDSDSDADADSLSKIVCFARDSDENRRFLAGADGFVPMLVQILANAKLDLAELAVRAMDLIRGEIADVEKLVLKRSDCLGSLVLVLQRGSVESRIGSARVLESIAVDAESKLVIAEREEVLPELLKLVSPEKDRSLMEAGISCLIAISMRRRVKVKLVKLGVVKALGKCLGEKNLSVSMTEKVLRLMEMVSSVKEGWSEMCECECECVERVLERVLKISSVATEHAVALLWNFCYVHRDRAVQEAVQKANGVTKILVVMQTNCSPAVRQMSSDLLKVLRLSSTNSASFLSSYDTNTTHITPF